MTPLKKLSLYYSQSPQHKQKMATCTFNSQKDMHNYTTSYNLYIYTIYIYEIKFQVGKIFLFLKEVFYAHQCSIYLIKNTVK